VLIRNIISIALSVLALSSTCSIAASFTIAPEPLHDLRVQRKLLGDKVRDLEAVVRQIEVAKSEQKAAIASIKRLEAEYGEARRKLESLQNFDRENPGEMPPEKLRIAGDRNREAFRALKEAKEKRDLAGAKINNELNLDLDTNYAEYSRLKSSFERDVNREVDKQLQEREQALQQSKVVEVTERVPCGDDSIPVCKERSKKAAELKATERGSVVFVNSMTEIKNFKLSKEELRSEVQATLTDKVFSNQHMVGETEYETTIRASVVPAISDSLRKQMAEGLRSEVYSMVGGKIDFVRNPVDAIAADTTNDEYEEPVPVKKTRAKVKPKPVVIEEEEEPQQAVQQQPQSAPPKNKVRPTISF